MQMTSRFSVRFPALAMVWLGIFIAGARFSAQPAAAAADRVGFIKMRDESIDQVLELLERWTGRTILRPQALPPNTYTLTLEEPVERDEAVLALETLLNMNGVGITPMGQRFLKVTPLNQMRAESPEFIQESAMDLPPSGRIGAKLFQLKFLRVTEFLPQISAILNPNLGAPPVLFEKTNSALITDSISNLQRIEMLLARLDQPAIAEFEPKAYTLQSARASDVVTRLRSVLSGPLQTQLGTATSYQADDRTNQVILVSDPRELPFFDQLIALLDVKVDPNTRNEVLFLKNAAAVDVATLLSELVSGLHSAGRERPAARAAAQGDASPPPLPEALAALELTAEFSQFLTILPEERSNALVVSGTPADIRQIRELVGQIDVLLAQVRIEVVIAEVTLGDEATSGINALGLTVVGNRLVRFSADAPGITITDGVVMESRDLAAEIAILTTPRKAATQILSVPTIITTHNKEGEIFVGEQRPFITSFVPETITPDSFGVGFRSTVTAMDIGIMLTVKPLIGPDGSVQLEISQEVNDIIGEVIFDGNPLPRVGRRSTKSFISVQSGEIIVLGGLQRSSTSRTTSRLGPIPIIGDLFGTRRREETRTDLVFFLRPYVLTQTPADNVEAMRRVDEGPMRDGIRSALDPEYRPPDRRQRN